MAFLIRDRLISLYNGSSPRPLDCVGRLPRLAFTLNQRSFLYDHDSARVARLVWFVRIWRSDLN
jgi:hypothetical protein